MKWLADTELGGNPIYDKRKRRYNVRAQAGTEGLRSQFVTLIETTNKESQLVTPDGNR